MKQPLSRSLSLAIAILGLTHCEKSKVDLSALESQVSALTKKLEDTKRISIKLRAELTSADKATPTTPASATLQAREQAAQAQLSSLQAQFSAYQDSYRSYIRQKAPGMEMLDLQLRGHQFTSLKVKSVDDTWFVFQHAGGAARILMRDVPQYIRDLFACTTPQDPPTTLAATATTAEPSAPAESSSPATDLAPAPGYDPSIQANATPDQNGVTVTRDHDGHIVVLGPGKKLPPKGKTHDGYDIIMVNGKAAVVLSRFGR
jgi:hypothetical protein